jgi:hypothetical protein
MKIVSLFPEERKGKLHQNGGRVSHMECAHSFQFHSENVHTQLPDVDLFGT